jgi:hypothetical protein
MSSMTAASPAPLSCHVTNDEATTATLSHPMSPMTTMTPPPPSHVPCHQRQQRHRRHPLTCHVTNDDGDTAAILSRATSPTTTTTPPPPSCVPRHRRRRPQHPLVCHVTDDDAPLAPSRVPRLPPLNYDNCCLPPIFDEQPDHYDDPRYLTRLFKGYPHPNDMNAASRGSSTTPHPNKDPALPARNQVSPTPLLYSPFPLPHS